MPGLKGCTRSAREPPEGGDRTRPGADASGHIRSPVRDVSYAPSARAIRRAVFSMSRLDPPLQLGEAALELGVFADGHQVGQDGTGGVEADGLADGLPGQAGDLV